MIIPSINTLGLPDWTFQQVVAFARQARIPHIEIRALENTTDLLSLDQFSNEAGVHAAAHLLRESGVDLLALNLGFHLTDDLYSQSEVIRQYAALGRDLGALYLRFFSGGTPGEPPDLERMAQGAGLVNHLLADFPLQMIVETHDALVRSEDILALAQRLEGHLNILWDIAHTHNFGGETWQETYQTLSHLVRYLHVKDTRRQDGKIQNVPLNAGDLNVEGLFHFFQQIPEPIIVSLEWEKMWDPSLGPGDLAALDFLRKLSTE